MGEEEGMQKEERKGWMTRSRIGGRNANEERKGWMYEMGEKEGMQEEERKGWMT